MRFAIGEIVVDVVIDDDDFELPLVEFLPGLDLAALGQDRTAFEPELFSGDALQVLQPGVSTSSCLDPGLAATTRRTLLEEAASTGRLIVPGHFRGPRRAHVRATGGSFRPVFPE